MRREATSVVVIDAERLPQKNNSGDKKEFKKVVKSFCSYVSK